MHEEAIITSLRKRRNELSRTLGLRDVKVERQADEVDAIERANELDLTVSHMNRESETIRLIDLALRRLENNEYGICDECEQQISPARLKAVPWAQYCIRCQEEEDRRSTTRGMQEAA